MPKSAFHSPAPCVRSLDDEFAEEVVDEAVFGFRLFVRRFREGAVALPKFVLPEVL